MAVSGDKVHMEVIKVKRGCKGGALDKFDSLQEEEDFSLSPLPYLLPLSFSAH